jgi:aminoglycoside phosphotransferase family enzyme
MEDSTRPSSPLGAESRKFRRREWIGRTLDLNEASDARIAAGTLEPDADELLNEGERALFEKLGDLLEARREAGLLKLCHGDLHLRNIFMGERGPTIFDAIEFNDTFAVIDVFYDLAFLLMDLDRFDMRRLGSFVLNHYLDVTWDTQGLALLPLFLSMRASSGPRGGT